MEDPKKIGLGEERNAKPGKTFFRGTDLQRNYRQLLDAAHENPVAIIDSRERHLAVLEWGRFAFADGLVRVMDALAQFNAVYLKHGSEPASEWASMTPFPFLAAFDAEDVAQFAADQQPALDEAIRRRDLSPYFGNLRGWESSAETYNDTEMIIQMRDQDEGELEELLPPLDPDEA